MKRVLMIPFFLLFLISISAQTLPWPTMTSEQIYLPFALKWGMPDVEVKDKVVNFGPANCYEQTCSWMADTQDGTAMLKATFHYNTLIQFELEYVLKAELKEPYRQMLGLLRQNVLKENWRFFDLRPDLPQGGAPADSYKLENRDTRLIVKWREGEHSLFILLSLSAK